MSKSSGSWSCELDAHPGSGSKSTELRKRTTDIFKRASSEFRVRVSAESVLKNRVRGASAGFNSTEPLVGPNDGGPELEPDDASDTESCRLEDVLGDSVVVDLGDSLRADQLLQANTEEPSHVDNEESDYTDLKSLLEAAMVEAADGRGSRFLPVNELGRLLSEHNVRRALLAEFPDLPTSTLIQVLEATRTGVPLKMSLKKIFAITALLGRPGDAVKFLKAGIYDSALPLPPESSKSASLYSLPRVAIDEFLEMQWRVLAPYFSISPGSQQGLYHFTLDDEVILPFVSDEHTSKEAIRGGFGEVFQVKIHPAHHNFDNFGLPGQTPADQIPKANPNFALKKLRASPKSDREFSRELEALKRIKNLKSPHLIEVLATYKLKDSYYFMFPWADGGNLRDLWATESNKRKRDTSTAQLNHWFMKQCLGLARALQMMHDGRGGDKSTGFRHGDLKPENILWFRNQDDATASSLGTLVIADLGVARMHNVHTGISRPRRLAGTATYRPPECDIPGEPISRAYDMWTLGCVYLEFVTWLLLGPEAVSKAFPQARSEGLFLTQQANEPGIDDDSFFMLEVDSKGKQHIKAEIKPAVKTYFRQLRADPACSGPILGLLGVIEKGMLVPNAAQRLDASACVALLEEILERMDRDSLSRSLSKRLNSNAPLTSPLVKVEDCDTTQNVPAQLNSENLQLTLSGPLKSTNQLISFQSVRSWLDRWLGTKSFDMWPLPPAVPDLPPGSERLIWTYGGQQMSITLDEDAVRRWRHWRGSLTTTPSSSSSTSSNGAILPSWQTSPSSTRSSAASTVSSVLSLPYQKWTSKSRAATSTMPPKPPLPPGAACRKESYLCVDRPWTSVTETKLSTLVVADSMADDYDLFIEARKLLNCAQGNRMQRFFSWRSYTHVALSQFHFLFNNSDRVKAYHYTATTRTNQPSADICKGYEYTTQHPEVDKHMEIMAEIILQGIRNPKLGRGHRTVMDGIPKLKSPPGLKKQALISGWGFHAGRGPCAAKIWAWLSAFVALGLAFVPFWLASIDKADLQNAFAPVSFLLTLLGVMFAMGCLVPGE
ncbi:Protein kinase-like domain containing protein [Rhypophila decipiens]